MRINNSILKARIHVGCHTCIVMNVKFEYFSVSEATISLSIST